MRPRDVLLILPVWIALLAVIPSDAYTIRGRLLDMECLPVAGATVTLGSTGEDVFSDTEGFFSVSPSTGVSQGIGMKNRFASARLVGDRLLMTVPAGGAAVTVEVFDLRGQRAGPRIFGPTAAGTHCVTIDNGTAVGMRIARLRIGKETRHLYFCAGVGSLGAAAKNGLGATVALAKGVALYPMPDSLLISAAGYRDTVIRHRIKSVEAVDNIHGVTLLKQGESSRFDQEIADWNEWNREPSIFVEYHGSVKVSRWLDSATRAIDTAFVFDSAGVMIAPGAYWSSTVDTAHWPLVWGAPAGVLNGILVLHYAASLSHTIDTIDLRALSVLTSSLGCSRRSLGGLVRYDISWTWDTTAFPTANKHMMSVALDNGIVNAEFLHSEPNFLNKSEVFGPEGYRQFFGQFSPQRGSLTIVSTQSVTPRVEGTVSLANYGGMRVRIWLSGLLLTCK
jgi:hypothetical protein